MSDVMLLFAQAVLTACLMGWMLSGVLDNWRHPLLNENAVAMVMRFELMEADYPEDFAHVKHRKVENPKVIRAMFILLVLWESVAALFLSVGTVSLVLALFGVAEVEMARTLATLGALAFTANWAGFLIGGNYFCYWYCHFPAQATHMMLALWGTLVVILLQMG